jgi:hypothetical protein
VQPHDRPRELNDRFETVASIEARIGPTLVIVETLRSFADRIRSVAAVRSASGARGCG